MIVCPLAEKEGIYVVSSLMDIHLVVSLLPYCRIYSCISVVDQFNLSCYDFVFFALMIQGSTSDLNHQSQINQLTNSLQFVNLTFVNSLWEAILNC